MMMPSFTMAWRFTDPRFNVVPSEDLESIDEVSAADATAMWKRNLAIDHLLMLPGRSGDRPLRTVEVDWSDPAAGRTLLAGLGYPPSERITFFWGPSTAVETTWSIFLKYWDDFFYPDDDNDMIVVHGMMMKKLLLFEERIVELSIEEGAKGSPARADSRSCSAAGKVGPSP